MKKVASIIETQNLASPGLQRPRTEKASAVLETQNLSKPNTMMLASMVEVPPNLSKILRLYIEGETGENLASLH